MKVSVAITTGPIRPTGWSRSGSLLMPGHEKIDFTTTAKASMPPNCSPMIVTSGTLILGSVWARTRIRRDDSPLGPAKAA